jgi:hypothetical protein
MDYSELSADEQETLMQILMDAIRQTNAAVSNVLPESNSDPLLAEIEFDQSIFNNLDAFVNVCAVNVQTWSSYTTLMVRNIPRKCSQRMLLTDIVAAGYGHAVDFLYLPTDISSAKNLGYAFINFMQPDYASSFRDRFHKKHLPSMRGSRAGISVSYAVIQGLEANVENVMKNASVHRIRNPEYLPLVYSKTDARLVPCGPGKRRNSHSGLSFPSSPQLGTIGRPIHSYSGSFLSAY